VTCSRSQTSRSVLLPGQDRSRRPSTSATHRPPAWFAPNHTMFTQSGERISPRIASLLHAGSRSPNSPRLGVHLHDPLHSRREPVMCVHSWNYMIGVMRMRGGQRTITPSNGHVCKAQHPAVDEGASLCRELIKPTSFASPAAERSVPLSGETIGSRLCGPSAPFCSGWSQVGRFACTAVGAGSLSAPFPWPCDAY
jgi:hypothetical protein